LIKVNTFIDINLERFSSVFAAAGHPNCVFKINFDQLSKLTLGVVTDLIE